MCNPQRPWSSTAILPARVVVVHQDETMLDLVQYTLEQAGITTAALLPDARGVAGLLPYLPPQPRVCVLGATRSDPLAWRLRQELNQRFPACALLLLLRGCGPAPAHPQPASLVLVHEDPAALDATLAAVVRRVAYHLTGVAD